MHSKRREELLKRCYGLANWSGRDETGYRFKGFAMHTDSRNGHKLFDEEVAVWLIAVFQDARLVQGREPMGPAGY